MSDPTAATEASDANACALSPSEMADRLVQWREVTAEALGRRGEPGRVVSIYPLREDVMAKLRELIEAETRCCPFLTFDLREEEDVIEVELRYPPEFEPMVAVIVPETTPGRSYD